MKRPEIHVEGRTATIETEFGDAMVRLDMDRIEEEEAAMFPHREGPDASDWFEVVFEQMSEAMAKHSSGEL